MNRAEVIESKLLGEIEQTRDLLDLAREHNTPFINTLAQELEEKQVRLAQLIDLRERGFTEQEFEAFLTPTERKAFAALKMILDPERLRLNLLLASLYLTAFEVLRNSIVEHINDFFVINLGTEGDDQQLWDEMLIEYEQEVSISFATPDHHKLIPSCKWLQKNGVLSEEEIGEIKEIRDHRNRVGHG